MFQFLLIITGIFHSLTSLWIYSALTKLIWREVDWLSISCQILTFKLTIYTFYKQKDCQGVTRFNANIVKIVLFYDKYYTNSVSMNQNYLE